MKKQNIKLYIPTVAGITMNIDLSFKPTYFRVLNLTQAINSNDNAFEFYWVHSNLCSGPLGYATYLNKNSSELIPIPNFVNGTYNFTVTDIAGASISTNNSINGAIVAVLEFSTD